MFREMRKKEREVFDEELRSIIENGEYGNLATINEDGYPYVVPISYVYYNNFIYFHCAKEGQKLDNISRNNKVSFSVISSTEVIPKQFSTKYKSVIAFGEALEVFEEEKEEVLLRLIEKYSVEYLEQGKKYISAAKDKTVVIKIDIKHITGKVRE